MPGSTRTFGVTYRGPGATIPSSASARGGCMASSGAPRDRPDAAVTSGNRVTRPAARWATLATVAAALLLVALVRLRLADVPLERDEGEYAYAGQLILHGIPPYQQAYNMKFPGTYY